MVNFTSADWCGGCDGLGRHTRWCTLQVGPDVSVLGRASDAIAEWGDRIGSTNMDLANACYDLAARLSVQAVGLASMMGIVREDQR